MRSLYHGAGGKLHKPRGNQLPRTLEIKWRRLLAGSKTPYRRRSFPWPEHDLPLTRSVIYRTLASRLFNRSG